MGRNIDDIIEALPKGRRDRINVKAETLAQEMIRNADSLIAFRKAAGKTQAEVGKVLGIGQNAVSQLENRADLYVSTLSKYVGALGMKLELSLRTTTGELVELANFHPWELAHAIAKSTPVKASPPGKAARQKKVYDPAENSSPLKRSRRSQVKHQHAVASK